jgi:hypothetical protein
MHPTTGLINKYSSTKGDMTLDQNSICKCVVSLGSSHGDPLKKPIPVRDYPRWFLRTPKQVYPKAAAKLSACDHHIGFNFTNQNNPHRKKKSKNYKKVTIEDALNEREAYRVAHKLIQPSNCIYTKNQELQ